MTFDHLFDYDKIDFRQNPHLYRMGKGGRGILLVEPYKSEMLPHWQFHTVELARQSAETIYQMFLGYKEVQDFVGMDVARKFLHMGYTRARRYANHPTGRQYVNTPPQEEMQEAEQEVEVKEDIQSQAVDWDSNEQARAARIFYGKYIQAKSDPEYLRLRQQHRDEYEHERRPRRL